MKKNFGIEVFLKLRPFSHMGNLGHAIEIHTLRSHKNSEIPMGLLRFSQRKTTSL